MLGDRIMSGCAGADNQRHSWRYRVAEVVVKDDVDHTPTILEASRIALLTYKDIGQESWCS
jgi:hypothetical protein